MATKTCPSCGADVPVAATRCKHCFHDFTEEPAKKNHGLTWLLALFAVMLVFGAATLGYVYYNNAAENIVVDAETHSIVITRTSSQGITTQRIPFDSIAKIEHVMGGKRDMFEVVAVTTDGERYIIQRSDEKPLTGHAEHVAAVVGKPYEEVRNIKTFGD